jgi:hypothetical protein
MILQAIAMVIVRCGMCADIIEENNFNLKSQITARLRPQPNQMRREGTKTRRKTRRIQTAIFLLRAFAAPSVSPKKSCWE